MPSALPSSGPVAQARASSWLEPEQVLSWEYITSPLWPWLVLMAARNKLFRQPRHTRSHKQSVALVKGSQLALLPGAPVGRTGMGRGWLVRRGAPCSDAE